MTNVQCSMPYQLMSSRWLRLVSHPEELRWIHYVSGMIYDPSLKSSWRDNEYCLFSQLLVALQCLRKMPCLWRVEPISVSKRVPRRFHIIICLNLLAISQEWIIERAVVCSVMHTEYLVHFNYKLHIHWIRLYVWTVHKPYTFVYIKANTYGWVVYGT